MNRALNIAMVVWLFCGFLKVEAEASVNVMGEQELDDAIFLINSPNNQKNRQGASVLSNLTGSYIEARYFLGLWLLKKNPDNIEERRKGLCLIMSAYYEGDKNASYFMAGIYKKDQEIYNLKNEKKAVELLKKLVASDKAASADVKARLGRWLLEEDRIKNKKEAIYWLEEAFKQGDEFACSDLALLFTDGEEKNLVKAWFYSDLCGTSMAKEKHELEKQMTPEQIEQAQNMSWKWQDAHNVRMPGYRGNGSPIHWQVEYH